MELIAGWSSGYFLIQNLPFATKYIIIMSSIKLFNLDFELLSIMDYKKRPVVNVKS
jgi:hypothetical protein